MKRSFNILVCDDSQVQRVIVKKTILTYFAKYNIKVLEATNGLEAFNILKKEGARINLLFLDLEMPVLNGWQLMEMIENKETYNLDFELNKVIVFSANPALREQAVNMILNVFKKPFLPIKLAEKLQPIIDKYSEESIIETEKKMLIEEIVVQTFASFSKITKSETAVKLNQEEVTDLIIKDLDKSKEFEELLDKAMVLKK